jgi:hypothetical protein
MYERPLQEMSEREIAALDVQVDEHVERYRNRAFSESALNGLPKGLGGLMVSRLIERNKERTEAVEAAQATIRVEVS